MYVIADIQDQAYQISSSVRKEALKTEEACSN